MITYNDIYTFVVHSYLDTVNINKSGFPNTCDWMHFISTDEYYYYTLF